MSASKFKVGDVVVLVQPFRRYSGPERVKIAKVGHKYVQREGDERTKFDRNTGSQAGDWAGHSQLYTEAEYAVQVREDEARKVLYGWGIDAHRLPIGKLMAVYEALIPVLGSPNAGNAPKEEP